jgi:hypothetical protein
MNDFQITELLQCLCQCWLFLSNNNGGMSSGGLGMNRYRPATTDYGDFQFPPMVYHLLRRDYGSDSEREVNPPHTVLTLRLKKRTVFPIRPLPQSVTNFLSVEELEFIEKTVTSLYQNHRWPPLFTILLCIPIIIMGATWSTGLFLWDVNFLAY